MAKKPTKKVTAEVKLQVPAGKANPAPPIGTALGPRGVNIMDFCKAFNDQTKKMEPGTPIPVVITVYADRSFTFVTKTPPNTFYIKKALGVKKCTSHPGRDVVGKLTYVQLKDIAEQKMRDTNANDLDGVIKMIAGSARSMGVEVEEI